MTKSLAVFKTQNLFLLFLITALSIPSTLATPVSNQIKQQNNQGQISKKHDVMEDYQRINNPPQDFPDLPLFNGHTKFAGGFYLPNQNGISVCQMKFFAQETPQTVIDFYKDALAGNGWKILHTAGTHLTARHNNGHMCSVNASESRLPKTKSQFTIAYRQIIKQR